MNRNICKDFYNIWIPIFRKKHQKRMYIVRLNYLHFLNSIYDPFYNTYFNYPFNWRNLKYITLNGHNYIRQFITLHVNTTKCRGRVKGYMYYIPKRYIYSSGLEDPDGFKKLTI
jgi:hypothetical protein